jgi:hypothetical protein
MATPIAPQAFRTARVAQHGGRGVRLAIAITLALALAALALGAVLSPPAEAAKVCGERGVILKRLEQRHEETPQALGLSDDGGVIEVLVAPDGGWTILVTYPSRPTCVVAVGEGWQMLQLAGGDGA